MRKGDEPEPAGRSDRADESHPHWTRVVAVTLLLILLFTPLFYYNLIQAVPVLARGASRVATSPIGRLYHSVVRVGSAVGLGTLWRMYSPARRSSIWVRWYVREPGAEPEPLLLRDMSPEYQLRRSTLDRWLWDSRRPILSIQWQRDPNIRESYARYLCRTRIGTQASPSVEVVAMEFRRRTPPPELRRGFSPFEGGLDEIRHLGAYRCRPEAVPSNPGVP